MNICPTCQRTQDSDRDDPTAVCCFSCWYSGAHLAVAMRPVLDRLTANTYPLHWAVVHSGGSCFHIQADLTDADDGPHLVVSSAEGPLAGTDYPADVDREGGWTVSLAQCWEDDDPRYLTVTESYDLPAAANDLIGEWHAQAEQELIDILAAQIGDTP